MLKVKFNPLAFTIEEVNQLLIDGHEPLPHQLWKRPEKKEKEKEQDSPC